MSVESQRRLYRWQAKPHIYDVPRDIIESANVEQRREFIAWYEATQKRQALHPNPKVIDEFSVYVSTAMLECMSREYVDVPPSIYRISGVNNVDFTQLLRTIRSMRYNGLRHYIVPGLTSYLLGDGPNGKIRLFSSDRAQRDFVLPHSHRFAFTCIVLQGTVDNVIYQRLPGGDLYATGHLVLPPGGGPGDCILTPGNNGDSYVERKQRYTAGESYSMQSSEIHSIWFGKDTEVLFFEGPRETDTSIILEPWANGARVPTYGRAPWMFEPEVPR